jgi:hypothetical protein
MARARDWKHGTGTSTDSGIGTTQKFSIVCKSDGEMPNYNIGEGT